MPFKPKKIERPWISKPTTNKGWSGDGFYQTTRWRKDAARHKRAFPCCAECLKKGKVTPTTVSDHIIPIEQGGDVWDWNNRQGLCTPCHNRKSAGEKK